MNPSRAAAIEASPDAPALTAAERERFQRDGLLVLRGWSPPALVAAARELAREQLAGRRGPLELEVDVGYPGAPASRATPGAETVRRLLRAYDRGEAFRAMAASPAIGRALRELMGGVGMGADRTRATETCGAESIGGGTASVGEDGSGRAGGASGEVLLVQAHHNCVMTKMPNFSSLTNWHQDVRYWCYQRPELISAWFALGRETEANGCLSFIPGTHRMNFPRDRLDEQLFLRTDRDDNRALLATAVTPELEPGDLVFFHCRLFHAAGRNRTDETKFSLVCTYRTADNLPLPGTKSGSVGDVAV